MKDLEGYIQAASKNGQPPRPGIILGIRMSLVALQRLKITDLSQHRKSLIVIVETDRCLPDAVQLVTGCRLGNRTSKLRDLGKMAATFVDLLTGCAIRLAARESANEKAVKLFPTLGRMEALSLAYRTLGDEEMYTQERVRVNFAPEDLPGYHIPRLRCAKCGEGVIFHREVRTANGILCRACAGERYYESLE